MHSDTIVILVVAGLLLFVWLPALVCAILRTLRKSKPRPNHD